MMKIVASLFFLALPSSACNIMITIMCCSLKRTLRRICRSNHSWKSVWNLSGLFFSFFLRTSLTFLPPVVSLHPTSSRVRLCSQQIQLNSLFTSHLIRTTRGSQVHSQWIINKHILEESHRYQAIKPMSEWGACLWCCENELGIK